MTWCGCGNDDAGSNNNNDNDKNNTQQQAVRYCNPSGVRLTHERIQHGNPKSKLQFIFGP
jgi:hypothetical protein